MMHHITQEDVRTASPKQLAAICAVVNAAAEVDITQEDVRTASPEFLAAICAVVNAAVDWRCQEDLSHGKS